MAETYGFFPDPANPGWLVRSGEPIGQFIDIYGEMRLRIDPDGKVRMRVQPEVRHGSRNGTVHGGFALAIVDQALFVCPAALGITKAVGGVTIEVGVQFMRGLAMGRPVDAVVEILRETGRMIFMRGLIEQDGAAAVSFSGTIKKGS